jgi:hypothetical protein
MLAAVVTAPELELSPREAHTLAEGIANVSRHYEWLHGASQKWVDIGNLAIVAGTIYAGKVFAIRSRMEAGPMPQRTPANAATPAAPRPNGAAPSGMAAMEPGGDMFAVEIPSDYVN